MLLGTGLLALKPLTSDWRVACQFGLTSVPLIWLFAPEQSRSSDRVAFNAGNGTTAVIDDCLKCPEIGMFWHWRTKCPEKEPSLAMIKLTKPELLRCTPAVVS